MGLLPGYGFTAVSGPVARTGASSAASGRCAEPDTLALLRPGGAALTGLRAHRRQQAGSPNKTRQATPPGDVPNLIRWRCFVPVALR